MTVLFDRRVTVTVDTIQFTGLDVSFKVEKTLKPQPNTCELTIWNLTEDHQAQLEQLRPRAKGAVTTGVPCKIEAGYAEGTSLIWLGDLRTVDTIYDASDSSWVTHLTSGDGEKAWKNAKLHVSFGPKTGLDTALRAMVRALGVGEGNLGKVVAKLKQAGSAIYPHGTVISGPVSRELKSFAESADLEVSIQDGALQFIDRGKALGGTALLLNSDTGLLDSPTVDNEGVLTAKIQMIPGVRCGGLVTMDAKRIKGTYRIEQATWNGETAGQEWGIEIIGKRY
jgi:hypothetical protein